MKKINSENKKGGLWIPPEVLYREELSLQEKFILAQILNLDKNKGCFAGNGYFSKLLGVTKGRVSKIVSSLEQKGFLVRELDKSTGNFRRLFPNYTMLTETMGLNNHTLAKNKHTLQSKADIGMVKNRQHIKELNKKLKNNLYNNRDFKNSKNGVYDSSREPDYSEGLQH